MANPAEILDDTTLASPRARFIHCLVYGHWILQAAGGPFAFGIGAAANPGGPEPSRSLPESGEVVLMSGSARADQFQDSGPNLTAKALFSCLDHVVCWFLGSLQRT